ncbi:30S ribosomal protein S6 [Candidatus Fokinia solitaria]|uniref:Small ribosomal subunit protein bS6 n=1 Tax=Candidatus Fokinia solitaria TaxID=1802984 RepID=A0A2U8BRB4_9RICK|nr:30S ribosomal protein S6 [Candidatus Fokinia solitaria]AWD32868.1 30S ribosomal protein S6 [Candidatus Fokinia solitaria]
MRFYKVVIGLRHDMSSHDIENTIFSVRNMMEKKDCKVMQLERWGMRDLKYKVKNGMSAYFVIFGIECDGPRVKELTHYFSVHHENIVRFMVLSTRYSFPVVEESVAA